jgi:hypothetical protein
MGKRAFNWVLNVATVLCAALVMWQFMTTRPAGNSRNFNVVRDGAKIHLQKISWGRSSANVILAVSVSCPYCRASAGFYRTLITDTKRHGIRTIAVLPQPSRVYTPLLALLGIQEASDVLQEDFERLGVAKTPTLVIADAKGIVRGSWVGRLTEQQERDVYAKLQLAFDASAHRVVEANASPIDGMPAVSAKELQHLLANSGAVIIDTRDRSQFNDAHIIGSLSMPLDEIEERAPHELPPGLPVVVFCHFQSSCEAQKREEGTLSLCSVTKLVLKKPGFINVKYIADDICTLASKRIPIAGKVSR